MDMEMLDCFVKSHRKKYLFYVFLFVLLTTLSFLQYSSLSKGSGNFWLWQLYLQSDLYSSVVGLPLLYLSGIYFISATFFSNSLVIIRLDSRKQLMAIEWQVQLAFLGSFLLLLATIAAAISVPSSTFSLSWTPENVSVYRAIFDSSPSMDIELLRQVFFTTIYFAFYLLFLTNSYTFFRLIFSEKLSFLLLLAFIFFQSFVYKMSYVVPLLPIQHYRVANIADTVSHVCYWLLVNGLLFFINSKMYLRKQFY